MTRSTSLLAVHDAIFNALANDASLTAHLTNGDDSIFDYVPENSVPPYIVIRSPTENPWDMFGTMGQRDTFTVDIWSKYRGSKEVKEIAAHINDLLDRAALTVTGYTSVWIRNTMTTDMRDPDGVHWHGVMYFTINLHQS